MERWVEEIEGWEERAFSGGFDGLRDLADAEFSGAISSDDAWLYMVNGRAVSVVTYRETRDGREATVATIDRFEDASGTAYEAPHPSIPMLVAMKLADGETRGRYYSVQTPLDEVDATLSDGGFTGYIELSENVLSGDYYSVYQAGRSMDVAFIGNARRLLTGEEAGERMADEVGIFQVVAVDLDVVEIPEPASPADDGVAAGGAQGEAQGDGAGTGGGTAGAGAGAAGAASATDATVDEAGLADPTSNPAGTRPDEGGRVSESESESASEPASESEPPTASESESESESESAPQKASDHDSPGGAEPAEAGAASADGSSPATGADAPADAPRTVPSLDPDRSAAVGETTDDAREADGTEAPRESEEPDQSSAADPESRESHSMAPDAQAQAPGETSSDEATALREELSEARDELAAARTELASTRKERDDLAARVEDLERRLDKGADAAGGDGPSLTAAEAQAGTNLFVRYTSKSNCTVADVHDGGGNFDELLGNLQLTHHTQFESEGATVDGRPFEEWLESTQQYRFARWAVTTLPFEIRETGAADGLRDLYDALPDVDRIELDGAVGVTDEDGEHDVDFDLVFRNRMGEPLALATLETSREPVTETAMGRLVTDASAVVERSETLAGAFYVTSAFFSPEALETARDATSGSLLSRDTRRSYVKISRNRGYHLGLVESREETFHLSVPDL